MAPEQLEGATFGKVEEQPCKHARTGSKERRIKEGRAKEETTMKRKRRPRKEKESRSNYNNKARATVLGRKGHCGRGELRIGKESCLRGKEVIDCTEQEPWWWDCVIVSRGLGADLSWKEQRGRSGTGSGDSETCQRLSHWV